MGACEVIGGVGQPCEAAPCLRARLGVDTWGDAVADTVQMYSKVMGWRQSGGLTPHPGLLALSRLDLEACLAGLDEWEMVEILWRLRTFHRALLMMTDEEPDGS
jgi:hypothetical protein